MCLEVWIWMHQKYLMSLIVRKLFSVESKYCTYTAVHLGGWMNQQNNETYNLQCTNGKIIMTITIITNHMIINCSILICSNRNGFSSINV